KRIPERAAKSHRLLVVRERAVVLSLQRPDLAEIQERRRQGSRVVELTRHREGFLCTGARTLVVTREELDECEIRQREHRLPPATARPKEVERLLEKGPRGIPVVLRRRLLGSSPQRVRSDLARNVRRQPEPQREPASGLAALA